MANFLYKIVEEELLEDYEEIPDINITVEMVHGELQVVSVEDVLRLDNEFRT